MNYMEKVNSKVFAKRSINVDEIDGPITHEVHMGYSNRSVTNVILNTYNGRVYAVNHSKESIIIGDNSDISIVNLDNGYKVVIFRLACMLSAMLVNERDEGKIGCRSFPSEYKVPFGSIESNGYKVYNAVDVNKYEMSSTLKKIIYDALKHHYTMSSNSFELFCNEKEQNEFLTIMKQYEQQ